MDATTEYAAEGSAVTAEGNESEDAVLDWDAIDWRAHEDNIRRLRQRIFKATRDALC